MGKSTDAQTSLTEDGKSELDAILEDAANTLPGTFFTVTTSSEILYSNQQGPKDVLDPSKGEVDADTIAWFASTTKILTSIAVLQLVDKGTISFDSLVHKCWLPELSPPLRLLEGFDNDDMPVYVTSRSKGVTLRMLLNQTAGIGQEGSSLVQRWKKWTKVGGGHVNSCQEVNLVNTPLVAEPGTEWNYGNAAEWLGLLVSRATGLDLEDYFQEHICTPLDMNSTSFYPFAKPGLASHLMPLRFWNAATGKYEELSGQLDFLTLPRERERIQYCVGGGGIYTTTSDWAKVCRHILSNLRDYRDSCILSEASLRSLFEPTLPTSAKRDLSRSMLKDLYEGATAEDLDWSTGMCLYRGKGPRGGWGRRPGTGFWMGAAGSEVWIDPSADIACIFTTNLLPHLDPRVLDICKRLEAALYNHLVT